VQVVGIVERTKSWCAKCALYKLSANLFYATVEELLAKTNVQAVAMFTSTFDHRRVVETCAARAFTCDGETAGVNTNTPGYGRRRKKAGIHLLVNYETPGIRNQGAYKLIHEQNAIGDLRKFVVHDGHRGPKESDARRILAVADGSVPERWRALTILVVTGATDDVVMQGQRPTSVSR